MDDGAISIVCPRCGKALRVPAAAIGKKGRCGCGEVIALVAPAAAPGPKATKRQREFAESLGIEFPADITKAGISKLIDVALEAQAAERASVDELEEATPQQMVDQLAWRGVNALLITWEDDGSGRAQATIWHPDHLDPFRHWHIVLGLARQLSPELDKLLVSLKLPK